MEKTILSKKGPNSAQREDTTFALRNKTKGGQRDGELVGCRRLGDGVGTTISHAYGVDRAENWGGGMTTKIQISVGEGTFTLSLDGSSVWLGRPLKKKKKKAGGKKRRREKKKRSRGQTPPPILNRLAGSPLGEKGI